VHRMNSTGPRIDPCGTPQMVERVVVEQAVVQQVVIERVIVERTVVERAVVEHSRAAAMDVLCPAVKT